MKLTESAIAADLAASGQVSGPAGSIFWHDGTFGTGEEWTVLLKTTSTRYADLEAHLIANHEGRFPR